MTDPMPPEDGYRYLVAELGKIRAELSDLQKATGSQRNQSVQKLTDASGAIPRVDANSASAAGFGLSAGWVTYARVSIQVPRDKTRATLISLGSGTALDRTTGGTTSVSGRIVIAGESGVAIPAAKDAGSSAVNNIVTAMHTRTIVGVSGVITAELQLNPLNAAAFTAAGSNLAQISLLATFSS